MSDGNQFETQSVDENNKISLAELTELAEPWADSLVRAVVDTKQEVMAIGGEFHADEEVFLLDRGSAKEDVWGINIYPHEKRDEWVEFESMINLKPAFGNKTRGVDDDDVRGRIITIVNDLVTEER